MPALLVRLSLVAGGPLGLCCPVLSFWGCGGGALVLLTVGMGLGRGRSTPCVFHRRFSAPRRGKDKGGPGCMRGVAVRGSLVLAPALALSSSPSVGLMPFS